MSECRQCGAEITFGLTRKGKWMPLTVLAERQMIVGVDDRIEWTDTFVSHFAVCPAREHPEPLPGIDPSLPSCDEDPNWHIREFEPAFTERASWSHDVDGVDPGCEDENWHVRQLEPAC